MFELTLKELKGLGEVIRADAVLHRELQLHLVGLLVVVAEQRRLAGVELLVDGLERGRASSAISSPRISRSCPVRHSRTARAAAFDCPAANAAQAAIARTTLRIASGYTVRDRAVSGWDGPKPAAGAADAE